MIGQYFQKFVVLMSIAEIGRACVELHSFMSDCLRCYLRNLSLILQDVSNTPLQRPASGSNFFLVQTRRGEAL